MSRIMAITPGAYEDLIEARRELLDVAKTLASGEDRKAARRELIASSSPLTAPAPGETLALEVVDGVAYVPITGHLVAEASPCSALVGAQTEYGYISAAIAQAEADPTVQSIALLMDSPGGEAAPVDLTAQAIAAARKPIETRVSGMCASAAYWLASQTDRIIALSPLAAIGSIGVVYQYTDRSAAEAASGVVRRSIVSTGAPNKRSDLTTPEGVAAIRAEVDAIHDLFVRRVATGRHVTAAKVASDFGKGGVLLAEAALKSGMIDDVIGSHLSRPKPSPAGVASSAAATSAAIPSKEVRMDLVQLKAEHPEHVAAIKAEGIAEERARVSSLRKWADADPQNSKLAAIVREAEAKGQTEADVMPQIMVAMRATATDTPPPVAPKAPETAAALKPADEDKLVADAIALAKSLK